MKIKPYIDEYPCKCSGGDICYVVRVDDGIDYFYPTREEAQKELDKLNDKN